MGIIAGSAERGHILPSYCWYLMAWERCCCLDLAEEDRASLDVVELEADLDKRYFHADRKSVV